VDMHKHMLVCADWSVYDQRGGSTMTDADNDHDGHNHDDQLGEIYPTMLIELNCTFGVCFSCFHCCGRHCFGRHGLWPSWYRPNMRTVEN